MSEIATELFTAEDVEAATLGKVKPMRLAQWINRGYFSSQLLTGGRGKSRHYMFLNVLEAAMLAEMSSHGAGLDALRAINREYFRQMNAGERPKFIAWGDGDYSFGIYGNDADLNEIIDTFAKKGKGGAVSFINVLALFHRVKEVLEERIEERDGPTSGWVSELVEQERRKEAEQLRRKEARKAKK